MNAHNKKWAQNKKTKTLTGIVRDSSVPIVKVYFSDKVTRKNGTVTGKVKNFRYFLVDSFAEVIRTSSSEDTFILANNPTEGPSILDEEIGVQKFKPFWFNHPNCFKDRLELLTHSCSKMLDEGVICEFGVRYGITLQHIVDITQEQREYYGFDAFKGLPQSKYITRYRKGALPTPKSKIPQFSCPSVHIIKGWFAKTLKPENKYFDKIAFIHLDADIYESTKIALQYCHPYFQEGVIVQLDEIHGPKGNPRMHEYKAFLEYTKKYNVKYEILGIVKRGSASFRLSNVTKNNV